MLLLDLYLLRPTPFRHAWENPRSPYLVSGFLIATGVIYGLLLALFNLSIGEIKGVSLEGLSGASRTWFFVYSVAVGLMTVVAVHLGITIVTWLMARAIGGPGLLVGLYRVTAYLLPLGWPALPQLARTVVASTAESVPSLPLQWAYLPLAALGLALFFAGLFQIFVLTQGKGPVRSAAGVLFFVVFSFAVFLMF
ncbi:MAG: hypothetical protein IPM60_01660 [Rhodospirillales bacterium]|nr:hypothetical protein [Rhodospirillales bacterium]